MAREFEEETSVKTTGGLAQVPRDLRTDKSQSVDFFATRLKDEQFKALTTTTEETVVVRFCDTLDWNGVLTQPTVDRAHGDAGAFACAVVNVVEVSDVVTEGV
jgi:hypothetical protein